jgi:TonB dependent receptor
LIPGVNSINVPANVPIPFRDYLDSLRLDWAQSANSTWFLRGSVDSYTTRNNLVEQGTLPSTGLLTHNNYMNMVIGNEFLFSSRWLGKFILGASGLHLTQTRNSDLGFALAFPFSSTALTVSGFETFGDNQFATPITLFPSLRNQEKYQARYDVTNAHAHHAVKLGANLIHEPVLSGSFPGNAETVYIFPQNPTYYVSNPSQYLTDMMAGASSSSLGGSFAQNVQRLAFYAEDSWRVTPRITLNYGLRYSTTWGLFTASGRNQTDNPAFATLQALSIPLASGIPRDDRRQFAPRLGIAYAPGTGGETLIRAGFGMYFNDLAQNGWVTAFQAVNSPPAPCRDPLRNPGSPENAGCIPGDSMGGTGNIIAPHYRAPYAIHITGGVQRSFGAQWAISADYTHEQGNHGYRAYNYTGGATLFTPLLPVTNQDQSKFVPDINEFHSDNRSSFNALLVHLQGNIARRFNLIANYTFSKAQTWGCVLGELFDYVNGVCNPLNPFGPGDYGPSGEDVRHRFVLAGTWHAQGGISINTLAQAESARPFTITTVDGRTRIAINGVRTTLDQFRGTPYVQMDLRISRPIRVADRWSLEPFAEFLNLFDRDNPGANYVTNVASLAVPPEEAQSGNVTDLCANADCTTRSPIGNANQLRVPSGALGDFFGPGTAVGIPFAAQLGARIVF